MVEYLPRSAWGAAPVDGSGSAPLDPDQVRGVALHWPGTESHTPIASYEAVASALRGWQEYHQNGRGWSDIAYQVAVDQTGRAWTLRGFTTRSAANGDATMNAQYGAILLVLVQGEAPSAAMKATTREVVADFRRRYPEGTAVKAHADVRPEPTDCPGPAATAALRRGEFTPSVPPAGGTPTPPEGDDEVTSEQAEQLLELNRQILRELQGINARVGYVANDGMRDLDALRDKSAGPD